MDRGIAILQGTNPNDKYVPFKCVNVHGLLIQVPRKIIDTIFKFLEASLIYTNK